MKKYLFLIIAIITTLLSTVSFAERPIIVEVNEEKLWFNDIQPQIINGRTMVPIRSVSEALGLNVQWDSKTGMVILDDGYNVIRVTINSNNAI
ncbi:copper amine oxidase N-terminal domain-containing protein [Peptoclostridium acidaminophilum]|uniref:copper amine oxidase N-terminal domain-containing protein n=1 Tax=Peptoclostridium acidaminophilum TaxID=1731 RepID=UPI00046D8895|nr:copper amine oxidase N-terminal domain-containing protein [Peptoclostridium acidaminophilum]